MRQIHERLCRLEEQQRNRLEAPDGSYACRVLWAELSVRAAWKVRTALLVSAVDFGRCARWPVFSRRRANLIVAAVTLLARRKRTAWR